MIGLTDYHARNPEMTQATPGIIQIATVMNQQSQLLMQLTAMMSDTKREQEMAPRELLYGAEALKQGHVDLSCFAAGLVCTCVPQSLLESARVERHCGATTH
jgi:hypothetical protein